MRSSPFASSAVDGQTTRRPGQWVNSDAPVKRVASTDTFVGYAPRLEDSILPQIDDFVRTYREIVAY